jgi:uncharacterized protein affecting Mg2+/Co2+ transport
MDAIDVSKKIHVSVSSRYLTVPTQYHALSHPNQPQQHLFHFEIAVHNDTDHTMYLFSRHWVVLDDHGQEQKLPDQGMMVKQIAILSGEDYVYQGMCKLPTPDGVLAGLVGVQNAQGKVSWLPLPKHAMRRPVRLVVNEPMTMGS